ncbi:MAG: M24 family metallopeptidase, partial [Acidobacteria bacterium]|nr:M24 family metallopeptidase [Acidobacteriota bacterium]
WVRQSASLGDLAFQIFLTLVQEGVTEHLVFTELDHMVKLAGAETTYFMTGCGPNPVLKFMDMATERYQQGDVVLFNAEIAGPGGYFTQLVRTVSLGPPRPEVQQAFRAATGALEAAEALLKPGVQASTVYQAVRTTLEEAGYSLNLHPGHSQGLDIFERPLLDGKDNAELLPGMIVVVHPLANMASGGGVWVGETFVITETGAQRLHRSSRCLAQCGIPPGA